MQATRVRLSAHTIIENIHEHSQVQENKHARGAFFSRERAINRPREYREPKMTVGELEFGLFLEQIPEILELHVAGGQEEPLDASVASFESEPIVAHKIRALVGLQVFHDDELEEPAGLGRVARVVVPNANVVEFAERSVHAHDERVDAAASERRPIRIGESSNARVAVLARHEHFDLRVGCRGASRARVDRHLVEVRVRRLIVGR